MEDYNSSTKLFLNSSSERESNPHLDIWIDDKTINKVSLHYLVPLTFPSRFTISDFKCLPGFFFLDRATSREQSKSGSRAVHRGLGAAPLENSNSHQIRVSKKDFSNEDSRKRSFHGNTKFFNYKRAAFFPVRAAILTPPLPTDMRPHAL
jgi:hypothetical protein